MNQGRRGYIQQQSQFKNNFQTRYECRSKNNNYNSSFIEPYHIIDSENQQDQKYIKKIEANTSGNLNPQKIINSQQKNYNNFHKQNPNVPYISIKQIIQKQKNNQIKQKYYQTDKKKTQQLQASVHQKLLYRAIQSSQKECQMIQNMIKQLLQEEKLIQKQIQQAQKKKRMLKRMTPEIYQMEKGLQALLKRKLQRYARNQRKFQKPTEQNVIYKKSKIKKSVSSFNKTLMLKQTFKGNQSKNLIETKPNSPCRKVKDLNLFKSGCQKSQSTTIRKKNKQKNQSKIKYQKNQKEKKKIQYKRQKQ